MVGAEAFEERQAATIHRVSAFGGQLVVDDSNSSTAPGAVELGTARVWLWRGAIRQLRTTSSHKSTAFAPIPMTWRMSS